MIVNEAEVYCKPPYDESWYLRPAEELIRFWDAAGLSPLKRVTVEIRPAPLQDYLQIGFDVLVESTTLLVVTEVFEEMLQFYPDILGKMAAEALHLQLHDNPAFNDFWLHHAKVPNLKA